jgi:hypothetical protein
VYFLARLLHRRRGEPGTRRGNRVLGPFRQAVLVLRWFVDATRIRQLADGNRISLGTACHCAHTVDPGSSLVRNCDHQR